MVAKRLYDAGYEVDTCYDGEEAFESVLTENYDLIVLDLNLPGMDGMEILKELRQRNEETKVLILSARGQIADKVEGLDAGANDYMEKPFHLQELEARIRSLTRRKFVQKDVCLESGEDEGRTGADQGAGAECPLNKRQAPPLSLKSRLKSPLKWRF